jgi:predicted transcriptional regulator of viral defense system
VPPARPAPPSASLPPTFTRKQAEAAGLSKHALYRMRDRGELDVLGRGVYRRRGAELADDDLLELATRHPRATLCLTSALVRHGLSDAIPHAHDLALPRGTRAPVTRLPVRWHFFDVESFEVGRQTHALDAHTKIGLYSAERSIVDAFRMRSREGYEVGTEALKRWLRKKGAQPGKLLQLAATLPRGEPALRRALEVLL